MTDLPANGNSADLPHPDDWRRWFKIWQSSELVSVIPPGAKLAAGSSVRPEQCGKVPGQKNADDTWSGLGGSWPRNFKMDEAKARKAARDGAVIGMQGRIFPGLDIDVSNERDAAAIQQLAFEILGPTVVRSRPGSSRRLLMYRLADGEAPFRKRRVEWSDQ